MSLFTQLATAGGAIGGAEPSGLFSFTFRNRNEISDKSEIFMLVPPVNYQAQYGYRMTVHKTIGGTSFDWFGADSPIFNIRGRLHSEWIDQLPAPFGTGLLDTGFGPLNSFVDKTVNQVGKAASRLVSNFFPLNQMSGLEEFFRMRWMLYEFF